MKLSDEEKAKIRERISKEEKDKAYEDEKKKYAEKIRVRERRKARSKGLLRDSVDYSLKQIKKAFKS